jgi:DNA-binding transcriptional regulator YiaG
MTPGELRAWRHSLKLNRSGLGKLLGVSGRTVEHWEQGMWPIPAGRVILIQKLMEEGNRR